MAEHQFKLEEYPYTESQLALFLSDLTKMAQKQSDLQQTYRFILNCIDLTTLEGADNTRVVESLCQRAQSYGNATRQILPPAAVCVYPTFVSQAKQTLQHTGIRVASVAGAFPAGQSPIDLKVAEVSYAVQQGADEIDMVISRGKFLEERYQEVYNEIVAIRKACPQQLLKVILETGELKTAQNIYRASQLAIMAGADFIKTSTGKIAVGATPTAFLVMLQAVKSHFQKTGRRVGIKAAGGISDPDDAALYVALLRQMLGNDWLSNRYFRIGASRLANNVFDLLK